MSDQNRQRSVFVVNQSGLRSEFVQGEHRVVLEQSDQGPALIGVICEGNSLFRPGERFIFISQKLSK